MLEAKSELNTHPIKKDTLKWLELFLSVIDSRFRDMSLCGSNFQYITKKYRNSSPCLGASLSSACKEATTMP